MISYYTYHQRIYLIIHNGDKCSDGEYSCPNQEYHGGHYGENETYYSCNLFGERLYSDKRRYTYNDVIRCDRCREHAKAELIVDLEAHRFRLGSGFKLDVYIEG